MANSIRKNLKDHWALASTIQTVQVEISLRESDVTSTLFLWFVNAISLLSSGLPTLGMFTHSMQTRRQWKIWIFSFLERKGVKSNEIQGCWLRVFEKETTSWFTKPLVARLASDFFCYTVPCSQVHNIKNFIHLLIIYQANKWIWSHLEIQILRLHVD